MALESEFLRSCLEKCQITAGDLDNLGRQVGNPEARGSLEAARQSLDECLKHCEFAFKLI
ncbi:MAG: hypothetical protein IBX71_02465 [Candidatus Desulforudis sp.]|nr:hypothetical protein [Desulforudis sp.]